MRVWEVENMSGGRSGGRLVGGEGEGLDEDDGKREGGERWRKAVGHAATQTLKVVF
jgi:hypothetical protein